MSTIFIKKYSGRIKRKISEGQLSPSELPEIYVKKQRDIQVDTKNIENLYPAKIFNIISKNTSTEITSNTLGLRLTHVVKNSKPLFKKLFKTPVDLDKLDLDYLEYNGEIFLNTDKDYLTIGDEIITVLPALSLDPWQKNPLVSVRRLRDRFKINIKVANVVVELLSESLLEPVVKNDWLIFKDFLLNVEGKYYYVYSHSFEYYKKREVLTRDSNIVLKDQPIGNITVTHVNDKYTLVEYDTFRSNLFINAEMSGSLYIGLKIIDETPIFEVSQKQPAKYLFKVNKKDTEIEDFKMNPYSTTPLYNAKPENFYFVWDVKGKYNRAEDVPIGCERVLLSKDKILNRFKPTFKVNNETMYEDNIPVRLLNDYTEVNAPSLLKDDINELAKILGITA